MRQRWCSRLHWRQPVRSLQPRMCGSPAPGQRHVLHWWRYRCLGQEAISPLPSRSSSPPPRSLSHHLSITAHAPTRRARRSYIPNSAVGYETHHLELGITDRDIYGTDWEGFWVLVFISPVTCSIYHSGLARDISSSCGLLLLRSFFHAQLLTRLTCLVFFFIDEREVLC